MLEKKRRNARGKRKLGFTLVEVTISIVIASIIGLSTFAIVSSALDTFHRQEEVISAIDVKESVLVYTKDFLRTCGDMRLRNEWNKDYTNSITKDTVREANPDAVDMGDPVEDDTDIVEVSFAGEDRPVRTAPAAGTEYYLLDSKMKDCNLLYSYNGRVYKIESNYSGRIDYGTDKRHPDIKYKETEDGIKSLTCKAAPLFDEIIYGAFDVELKFKPIFTAQQGAYRDIQLIVNVMKRGTREVVVQGTETFHLLNLENRKKVIEFEPPMTRDTDVDPFNYCYFG